MSVAQPLPNLRVIDGQSLVGLNSDKAVTPPDQLLARLGIDSSSAESLLATLPFVGDDVTAGAEAELQAAVFGSGEQVDLPRSVRESGFFAQMARRAQSGDVPRQRGDELTAWLENNDKGVWENSWVKFPRSSLNSLADAVFKRDLLVDKRRPGSGLRSDHTRFRVAGCQGEDVRVPISYLVKLALADAIGGLEPLPALVREMGMRLLDHFLNDNTSPETFSFFVVPLPAKRGLGQALGREAAKRFALTHLLVQYANRQFELGSNGQRAMIYAAPQPPLRQRQLNDMIPDAMYRDLFMSPCLSGWDRGEDKHRYMHLCHEVLGRSRLNAVAKLRDAGVILNNLVVLPNLSNTSLANNGVHITLGSRRLTALRAAGLDNFGAAEEKRLGDLVIKIVEHFMPLFVGSYSAAPSRLGFADFHPENALGFLAHELDYTHLRMLWQQWRKKADLSVFGRSVTPFGPPWLDGMVAGAFRLKGDYVPDLRLIDYPVWLLSTYRYPALDGSPASQLQLKRDLAAQGVFDERMSLYLACKQRQFDAMGFCGFEGRQHSLFPEFSRDMGKAASLQTLVVALAYKYLAQGCYDHRHIPDDPVTESERRQMFFGTALGIPSFYVRKHTRNRLLRRILRYTDGLRASRRYPGYLSVSVDAYRRALLTVVTEDGAGLVEALGVGEVVRDLRLRLELPGVFSAAGRLTNGILSELGALDPMAVSAQDFNRAAEDYYRGPLRLHQLKEGLHALEADLAQLECVAARDATLRQALRGLLGDDSASGVLRSVKSDCLADKLPADGLRRLIHLLVLSTHYDAARAGQLLSKG
ncbi:hypothetical protein Pcar_2302 [Syntrophotalea carbinolica DSM 2380]|uniref:Uncharacterized protein n=1 Tax=Syntrophotalea carbinolica (strain DSM 2380 / NBRC 103641 / GraBd1) TaxID=338963 RepID=Q3A266_SYNC1|nr:hypothetical protein [Syntrophotalea carbinolica]ABA89541.1 hypothetical protein Pcar_2302 [Syntrophotalea carbinolica DSM 2380]